MRVSTTALWCFAFWGISHAASPYQNLTQIRASMPECSRHCSAPSISGLTCVPTSVEELAECLCPNNVARGKISECVQKSCDLADVYLAGKPSKGYCAQYPIESRSGEIRTAAIVLLAVTIPFVIGRGWSRMAIMKSLWWDDYTLALAATILIANLILNIPLSDKGLGKHSWDISPANAIPLTQMFYAAQIFYTLIQFITKISILLCFLRIFPQRWFRYTIYGTLTFVTLKGLIFLIVVLCRCLPIASVWDHSITPKCLKSSTIVYVAAGFSIFEDFWILGLPIPVLKSLKINRARKLVLVAMFSVGSLACVTSMVRLKYVKNFGESLDPTWDNIDISIWSVIENGVAVICACLPALRPLMSRLFPRVFGSSEGRATYGTQESASKRNGGERRLVDDFEPAGQRGSTRGTQIYGIREGDLAGSGSGSSFNYGRAESQEGIRLDTVVTIEVRDVKIPEKGHVKNTSFDFGL